MKKYKKKEMLETVSMLLKANDLIIETNIKGGSADIIDALTVCQEMAISLGSYIETLGEMGDFAVHILEDYCENVYQMSVNLTDEKISKKISKKIIKQLTALSNHIRYEFSDDKKEIVFLSYQASMWDSMESVWKAASEDESCVTYVIPIPYYNMNPDGSMGQMQYDGDKYPSDVPITSWKEYSMEERRPDIVYVHNPYDDWNKVTRIHPAYFSRELKKHVDTLVYIPYFVAVNDKVESHLCVTPVTIRADKIFVQSSQVRKTYIEELKKFESENNCKGISGDIEEKVIAIGSPKYDKVGSYHFNIDDLPIEWKNIICRADGTRKKVVLYNTSIQNLLTHNEKMIMKIDNSLRVFKEYKEDIALIWRPHPLIYATLQSMRPNLLNDYKAIVNKYCSAGWGIYDDTSDMNRAIAVSDAYYGDGGSMLELYKATGRAILLQRVEMS